MVKEKNQNDCKSRKLALSGRHWKEIQEKSTMTRKIHKRMCKFSSCVGTDHSMQRRALEYRQTWRADRKVFASERLIDEHYGGR